MTMLTPVGEHELLLLWIQLVVLLVTARSLGLLAQRFRQPRVVGELAAGVLVGPSIAGRLFPDLVGWLFPGDAVQSALLLSVAWLGILLLLLVTGFETDLDLLRRLGRPVVGLSLGSLVIPLAMGFALGWIMPASLWGAGADRLSFAAFIAVALAISSLPVIAKIMTEMGLMRRNVGQLTIAAAIVNDLIGWMLLGVAVGLFSAGTVEVRGLLITLGSVVVFLVLGLTVGQRIVDQVLRRARSAGGFASALTATIAVMLILGAITQAMGVEAVLGALVAGVVLGRSRYQRHDVRRSVEVLSSSIFAPIFFATAGLYVDYRTEPRRAQRRVVRDDCAARRRDVDGCPAGAAPGAASPARRTGGVRASRPRGAARSGVDRRRDQRAAPHPRRTELRGRCGRARCAAAALRLGHRTHGAGAQRTERRPIRGTPGRVHCAARP
jgi:Kef-type K+ transport system membrane component KefB